MKNLFNSLKNKFKKNSSNVSGGSIPLKGGNTTSDPRLDRVAQFDEKSREYPIRTLLEAAPAPTLPVTKTWRCLTWNDQGREGACVGFSWSHELAAEPTIIRTSNPTATRIYKLAQTLDQWPGEAYSGTSVLAGAKAVQTLTSGGKKIMPEYRWAFGIDDLILTVGNHGPAVLGIDWWTNMYNTDARGFVHVSGEIAGGHAILCRGITIVLKDKTKPRTLDNVDRDKSYFTLRNSWGRDWGKAGDCYVTVADMTKLLEAGGEACIPVIRKAT